MNAINIFLIYLLIINLIAFFVYAYDKGRAIRRKWRVPEATLITLAAIGGSIGSLLSMYIFHHKTKKPKFYVGVPAILVAQIIIIAALFYHFFV